MLPAVLLNLNLQYYILKRIHLIYIQLLSNKYQIISSSSPDCKILYSFIIFQTL